MKTPIENLIHRLETEDLKPFEILEIAKSLLPEERKVIEDAFNDGREGYHNANETVLGLEVYSEYEYPTFEQYYQTKFEKK